MGFREHETALRPNSLVRLGNTPLTTRPYNVLANISLATTTMYSVGALRFVFLRARAARRVKKSFGKD